MKLIIDIPEEHYRILQEAMKNHMESLIGKIILNGTPIPDDATNGDVIKTIFGDKLFGKAEGLMMVSCDWWNAPYQKGGKE